MDDHGSRIAGATFDLDDLDAAYDELDRRYGKAEAAHSRFVKWAAAHQSLAVLVEKDPLAWVLAPDFVVHDHSPLGWGTLDRSAYVESVKALAALSPDSRTRTDHVWLSDRAVLGIHVVVGTHEGGAYEQPRVSVSELDAEGRERRRDIYAPDQLDLARARFDALVARTASDPLAALARPNTATAAMDRVQAAYAARDWDAVRAACTADAPIEDRRRYVQLSGGVEGWITDLQRSVQAGSRYRRRLVSSSGERVALEVVNVTGGPPDGPWEIEFLWLIEVDDSGRITTALAFEMDDWRAARREERARWLAADATAAACLRSAVELANAFNTHDRSRVREILADDLVMDDHRRTGQGRVEGADAYVETLVDLWDLVPNIELDTAISGLPYDRHGCVTVGHYSGTLPEGGAFEIDTVAVCTVRDGLVTRLELFELDHLDDALARFAELRPAEAAKGMTG